MENITVNRLGQLYRLLCEALGEGKTDPLIRLTSTMPVGSLCVKYQ